MGGAVSKVTIYVGDALARLRELPSDSVQCMVTSPPYWSLRVYGDEPEQIGCEPTPQEYVAKLVEVFREARRVLRPDGVMFCNLGTSYISARGQSARKYGRNVGFNARWHGTPEGGSDKQAEASEQCGRAIVTRAPSSSFGLKDKDLCAIPWMVGLALQADGWYLRCDIIWSKISCLPESIEDRPSKSHEYVLMLTKEPQYYYDGDAVREPSAGTDARVRDRSQSKINNTPGMNPHHGLTANNYATRNMRSVWTINPTPSQLEHTAMFPPALPERCILAATSAHGACSLCGAPWKRVVERGENDTEHQMACGGDENGEYHGEATKDYAAAGAQDASTTKARILAGMRERKTIGWAPTCEHADAPVVPCVVLDPFAGAGTTGLVADRLGRDAILIELNPVNAELSRKRIAEEAPMFSSVEVRP